MNKINKITLECTMRCSFTEKSFIWFVPREASILCRYNLNLDLIDFMSGIPEDALCMNSYCKIVKYKEHLVLIPYSANKITVFNVRTKMFSKIDLPPINESFMKWCKFETGFCKDNYIYLIPCRYPYILRIDMKSLEVVKCIDLFQITFDRFRKSADRVNVSAVTWDGVNTLYIGVVLIKNDEVQNTGLLKIELDTLFYEVKKMSIHIIKGMICQLDHLFICSGDGKITVLDQRMKEEKVISDATLKDYKSYMDMYVAYAYACEDELTFIRYPYLDAIVWDLHKKNITKKKLIDEKIIYAGDFGNGVLIQTDKVGCFYIIENEKCKKKKFCMESKALKMYMKIMKQMHKDVYYENTFYNLQKWIDIVGDDDSQIMTQQYNQCDIYQYIKNEK